MGSAPLINAKIILLFSGTYLFSSELFKGIGTFSPQLFSLNEKGFFPPLLMN